MRAPYRRRLLAIALLLLLGGCGTPATPTGRDGQAVAPAPPRTLSPPTARAVEATAVPVSPPPTRPTGAATPTMPPPPAVTPTACSQGTSALHQRYADLGTLAWASHQIVAGEVVAASAPYWVDTGTDRPAIFTDYLVRVERQLRGFPAATVIVRRQGGTIGTCTHLLTSEPTLAVGDRLLLFLYEGGRTNVPPHTYAVLGGSQGYWALDAAGRVAPTAYPDLAGAHLDEIAARIIAVLSGPPPTSPPSPRLVPLDEAPLPAASPPTGYRPSSPLRGGAR